MKKNIYQHLQLREPFVKFEDASSSYRPILKQFKQFPQVDLDGDLSHGIFPSRSRNVVRSKQIVSYCECCECFYYDVDMHIQSRKHRTFVAASSNYEALDAIAAEIHDWQYKPSCASQSSGCCIDIPQTMSLPAPFDIGSAGANQISEAAAAEAAGCHGDVLWTSSFPAPFHMDTVVDDTADAKEMSEAAVADSVGCHNDVSLPMRRFVEYSSTDIVEDSCESEVFEIQSEIRLPALQLPDAEQSTSVTEASGAVVARTNNNVGKRQYDKKAYCIYCQLPQTHIVRHWEVKHKTEEKVKELMTLRGDERNRAITKLRNMGNHIHNVSVLEQEQGELAVAYRPSTVGAVRDYVPCEGCYAYLRKTDLYRHNCRVRGRTKGRVVANAALLLPAPKRLSDGVRQLIGSMREGEVKQVVQDDPVIHRLAAKLLSKHTFERKDYIRAKLREVSRFLLEMRKVTNITNMTVKDCINPKYFRQTIVAVKAVAGYSEGTDQYERPSTALKVGHVLKKCVKVCKSDAIVDNDAAGIETADRFLQLCELEWTDAVSTQAHRSLMNKQRNSVDLLPLSEDVSKLHSYLRAEIRCCQQILSDTSSTDSEATWRRLSDAILTHLICFNRRRAGEVSRMTVMDFNNRTTADLSSDIQQMLSKVERNLCRMFTRIELTGKRGRTVAILVTDDILQAMKVLVSDRGRCGINPDNVYMFAVSHSDSFIRGSDCLRSASTKCNAVRPESLRSTALRKHIATLCQVVNLKKHELDMLANFMGHDVNIHREFYRLPSETMQSAHIAKLFLLMETGDIGKHRGQSLEDVHVNQTFDKCKFHVFTVLILINICYSDFNFLRPRGHTSLDAEIFASALASTSRHRLRPGTFCLGLVLVLLT